MASSKYPCWIVDKCALETTSSISYPRKSRCWLLPDWALIVSQVWSLIGLLVSAQQFCYSNPCLRPALTVPLLCWCLIEYNCSMKRILTNNTSECNKSSYILISPPVNILFALKILVNTRFYIIQRNDNHIMAVRAVHCSDYYSWVSSQRWCNLAILFSTPNHDYYATVIVFWSDLTFMM